MKNCYNSSQSHEPISFVRTSQVTPSKEVTLEVVPTKEQNPTREKGKRKVSYSPRGEKNRKMKVDPVILKEVIAKEKKRTQRI